MELFTNANFDFLGKKWPFIIASLVLTAAGIASLVMKGGPRYGIDFKGGAMLYVKFAGPPPQDRLRAALAQGLGRREVEIQEIRGTNEVIISTEVEEERSLEQTRQKILEILARTFGQGGAGKLDFNNASQQQLAERLRGPLMSAGVVGEQQLQDLVRAMLDFRDRPPQSGLVTSLDQLKSVPGVTPQVLEVLQRELAISPYTIRNIEIVGPKIGAELRNQAILATLYALGGMLVYIAFRFEWIYGVAAVLAVFHDTILTIGLFSIFDKEITLPVVAALLTLVGYSMNDTIVIFDRIRENLKLMRREPFETIVNVSINQTLSRTILTSGLTFLSVLALWLFGGPVLNGFSFALVVGIIVGTYSSIFIASAILIFGQNVAEKRKRSRVAEPAAAIAGRRVREGK